MLVRLGMALARQVVRVEPGATTKLIQTRQNLTGNTESFMAEQEIKMITRVVQEAVVYPVRLRPVGLGRRDSRTAPPLALTRHSYSSKSRSSKNRSI
jgi:hypothetical protein